jgi:hypothetical protein
MAGIIRREFLALKPIRALVRCGFCEKDTWWAKRPALVYHGSHRYPRWCCEECGSTRERVARFIQERSIFVSVKGP